MKSEVLGNTGLLLVSMICVNAVDWKHLPENVK